MELQEFITKTLVQIMKGVADAQSEFSGQKIGFQDGTYKYVDFDVAVVATESSGSGAGIGVVGVLKGQMSSESAEGSVSRIQFKVPIRYPQG